MAWLNATPKPPEGSKRAKTSATLLTRLEQLKRDKIVPSMPTNPAPHIVDRLVEIGLTEAAGMGIAPLSWREINEWQRSVGIALAPWETRLIRKLSSEYIVEGRRAENEACPPPWRAEVTRREIETEESRLRTVLG